MRSGNGIGSKSAGSAGVVFALCGTALMASAQLGSFPASDFEGGSVLPVPLELAIAAKAPNAAAMSLMRASLIRALSTSGMCYKADLTPAQWQSAFDRFQFLPPTQMPFDPEDPFGDRFNTFTNKWGPAGTASSAFPAGDAIRTNLTYSFPNDGASWGMTASGFPIMANDLSAALVVNFGSVEYGREILRQALAGWRRYGGITYTENTDNNTAMTNTGTHSTAVGDIRIGGMGYDASTGVLAYNCFPTTGGLAGTLGGGDMAINTSWMGDPDTFGEPSDNYRYLRNVVAHEHGHGLGFIHQVPCSSSKLMEPFIQTFTDQVRVDDRRGVGRNYGDRYSGNQSLANAVDFGNLTTPALRSIALRYMSLNGYWNNGANATGADYYKFTIDSAQNVKIIATPVGGTYSTGQQSSGCSGTATSYNTSALGNLAYVLTNSDGTVTIGTVDATATGSAENFTFSSLPAGSYVLRVWDNNAANPVNGSNPNTIVQLYDLEVQLGTNVYADPYANAGLNRRAKANSPTQFIGDVNSGITENRIVEGILRWEWDLDGDGVFETGLAPDPITPQPTYSYVSNGVYTVKLRVRDSQDKTNIDTIQVTVFGATTTLTGNPISSPAGVTVPFTLVGTNFKNVTNPAMVTMISGTGVSITGTPVSNIAGTQLTGLSFVIDPSASLGGHTVRVGNIDGNASLANFLTVTAPPCPADLNGDLQVDDSDFVIFAAAYDILDCLDALMPPGCPADLNDDGFVDDTDFVMFAAAYDALLCS